MYKISLTIINVNKILRKSWNVIGFDDSLPEDEFCDYAEVITLLLKHYASSELIMKYLMEVEVKMIGNKVPSHGKILDTLEDFDKAGWFK